MPDLVLALAKLSIMYDMHRKPESYIIFVIMKR